MSATVTEGVLWELRADDTQLVAAYRRAEAASQKAGVAATNAAQTSERAFSGLTKETRAAGAEMARAEGAARRASAAFGRLAVDAAQGNLSLGGVSDAARNLAPAFNVAAIGASTLGAAVVGASAVSVAALSRWKASQDEFATSLARLGRFSGVSISGANALAFRAADASGTSVRSAQSLTAQYLGAGIGAETSGGLVSTTRDFSRKLVVTMDAAASELAQSFADPARGAEELAKKYGVLSLAQAHHIDELVKVRDRTGAASELLADLRSALDKIADRQSPISKLIDRIEKEASDALTGYGQALANSSNPFNQSINKAFGIQGNESASAVFARMRSGALAREYAARQADLAGQDILGIAKSVAPDLFARDDITQQIEKFKKALGRDGVGKVLEDLGVSADMTRETLGRLNVGLELLRTPVQRVTEENALRLRSIEAETVGRRAQIAAEQAYRAELESSRDRLAAVTAAEGARNAAIAEATRAMHEQAKDAARRASLAGLLPYQRATRDAELTLKEDLNKANLAPGAGSLYDPRGVADYIRERSAAYGLNPDAILRIAKSEGLGSFHGDKGTSFGALQLHVGGGLGDVFRRQTGLDPRDPQNERMTIDWGLRWMRDHGDISPWHGAARVGVTNADVFGEQAKKIDIATEAYKKYDATIKAINIEQIDNWLKGENLTLDEQRRAIDLSTNAWGLTKEALAGTEERQKLLNEAQRQGIDVSKAYGDSAETLAVRIERLGKKAEENARVQEKTRKRIEALDFTRNTANDVGSSVALAAAHGEDVGKAFRGSLQRLKDNLIRQSVSDLTSLFLGSKGSANGGLLGELFGFNGGDGASQSTGEMNVQAQVVNVAGGSPGGSAGGLVGKLFGDGKSGDEGLFGKVFSGIGDLFGGLFAEGGTLPAGKWGIAGEAGPELITGPANVFPSGSFGGGPKITVINNAHGVKVTPQISRGEIQIIVAHMIAANNDARDQTLLSRIGDRRNRES